MNSVFFKMMIYLFFIASFFIKLVHGNHQNVFRGGIITWRPATNDLSVLNTTRTIIIDQHYAWNINGPNSTCSSATILSSDLIGDSVTKKLTCNSVSTCNAVKFPNNVSTLVPCTEYNTTLSMSSGQRSTSLNLSVQTDGFVISYGPGLYWNSLNMPTGSVQWQLAMYVNLAPRADNNLINHSPTSSMPLVIYVPITSNTSISIPMSDDDGDIVKCRFAQSSNNMSGIIVNECSGVCYPTTLPSSTQLFADDNNCTLIVNLPSVGYYAVTIQIEDFLATSIVPLSSVPLQFLLYVYNPPVSSSTASTISAAISTTSVTTSTTSVTTSTTSVTTSTTSATTSTTSVTTSTTSVTTSTTSVTTSTTSATTSTTSVTTSTTSVTTSTTSVTTSTTSATTSTTSATTSTTSATTSTTSATTSTTSATTSAATTTITIITTTIKPFDYLPLVLGLGLGLGLPLLFLFSLMVICYKCQCCLRHLRSIINNRYDRNTDVNRKHRQQSTPFNNSQTTNRGPNDTHAFRKQYINDDDSSQRRANYEHQYFSSSDLFNSSSMSPFELGSLTTTTTSLFSQSSNNLPTDRVELMASPLSLPPNPSRNTGSILVRVYNEQHNL